MESNDKYYKKYLKYKSKYLQLKKNINLQQGAGFNPYMMAAMSAMNVAKNVMSNPEVSNQVMNLLPPQQKQLLSMLQQLVNPQNAQILSQLSTSFLAKASNKDFLPLVTNISQDIIGIMSSNPAILSNPLAVFANLNQLLGRLKTEFPNEFNLLKQFFASNRNAIIPLINTYTPGITNSPQFSMLTEFLFY